MEEIELMARGGEKISCEGGHPIGTFTKDVRQGDVYPDLIQWEIADPPRLDDELPLRCQCGAVWCKAVDEFLLIYVEGEWRPKISIA